MTDATNSTEQKISTVDEEFEKLEPLVNLIFDYPGLVYEILFSFLQDYKKSHNVESATNHARCEWDL